MKTKHSMLMLGSMAGVLLSIGACNLITRPAQAGTETEEVTEFVCYTDGKLTERHVGVRDAWTHGNNPVWVVQYIDSPTMQYVQVPGETCGTESYRITEERTP